MLRTAIAANQDAIARAIVEDTGKPVTEVLNQEITAAIGLIGDAARRYPKMLAGYGWRTMRPGFWTRTNRVLHEPLGVVAVIGPSNFPFSIPMMQTAAALLCGNTVVVKPSERSPRTSRELANILAWWDGGAGEVAVVEGGADVAERLAAHPAVRKVLFTGGRQAGANIAQICARHMKTCVLELGGSAAAVVCDDADLELAARGIVWSAFYAGGRSCVGTKRVFVDGRVADTFIRLLEDRMGELTVGSPGEPGTDLSAMPSADGFEPVARMLADAVRDGATLRTHNAQNDPADPAVVAGPTLVVNPLSSSAIMGAEIPARILCVRAVSSDEQAVREANASPYGLSASVWSRSARRAKSIAARLEAGMVWINDASSGEPRFPWGGTKGSGWGRLYSEEGVFELTATKVISHDHRLSARPKVWWFPYSAGKHRLFQRVNRFLGR